MRVTPRAARDEVAGSEGGVLRVRLRAPPFEGRANEALRRLPARRLSVTPRQVSIVAGETARTKRVCIVGLSQTELWERLEALGQADEERAD